MESRSRQRARPSDGFEVLAIEPPSSLILGGLFDVAGDASGLG
jgi:hypothetical protein